MLLIEFCGTPGCGKTTICDRIEEELQQQGIQVRNLQKRGFPATYKDKLKVKIERFRFRNYVPNRRLKKALKVLLPYYDKNSLIHWPNRILESFYRAKKAEKDGIEVGLFDEGCMQFITSVFHEKEVPDEIRSLVDSIDEELYQNRIVFFDCHIDLEENYERLEKRAKPNDRFLTGSREENLTLLKTKRERIDTVLGMLKGQTVMRVEEKDTEQVVKEILDVIMQRL